MSQSIAGTSGVVNSNYIPSFSGSGGSGSNDQNSQEHQKHQGGQGGGYAKSQQNGQRSGDHVQETNINNKPTLQPNQ